MLSFLSKFIPSKLYVILGAVILSSLLSGYGVWKVQAWRYGSELGQVRLEFSDYKTAVLVENEKANETFRTETTRLSNSLRDTLARLQQTQLNAKQTSDILQELINNEIKQGNDRDLGPLALSYFKCLRLRQQTPPGSC